MLGFPDVFGGFTENFLQALQTKLHSVAAAYRKTSPRVTGKNFR